MLIPYCKLPKDLLNKCITEECVITSKNDGKNIEINSKSDDSTNSKKMRQNQNMPYYKAMM